MIHGSSRPGLIPWAVSPRASPWASTSRARRLDRFPWMPDIRLVLGPRGARTRVVGQDDQVETHLNASGLARSGTAMVAFLVQRLFQAALVMLAVALIAFALVQLCRRSDQQHGRTGYQRRRPRAAAAGARARRQLRRSVCPVCRSCGARRFRPFLPAGAAGRADHLGEDAGHARIELSGGYPRADHRRADGHLYRPPSRHLAIAAAAGAVACRGFAADLSDRHSADPGVCRHARVAAVLRPRQRRPLRLVELGPRHASTAGGRSSCRR